MTVDENKASSSGKSNAQDTDNDNNNNEAAGKTNDKSAGKDKEKAATNGKNAAGKTDGQSPDKNQEKEKAGKGETDTAGKSSDKSPDKNKEKEKEKVAKSDNDTREVRKLFDLHVKAGDPHRINSGLSMENTKTWFEEADMINKKFGITEGAFEEAFKATAKGEDRNQVEFLEFIECIEMLADEISKSPQDLYNQLLSAEKPAQS